MTDIPENAKLARRRYEEGALTRDILAETGLNLWALYYWLAGGPKKNGVRAMPAIAKRKLVTRRRLLKEERLHMVERMMRAAERQMREIETRLAGSGQEPGASDRDARALAVLARTMQSLTALDALHEPKAGKTKKQPQPIAEYDDNDDRIPASIDALRRELSHRMAGMVAGATRQVPGKPDDPAT